MTDEEREDRAWEAMERIRQQSAPPRNQAVMEMELAPWEQTDLTMPRYQAAKSGASETRPSTMTTSEKRELSGSAARSGNGHIISSISQNRNPHEAATTSSSELDGHNFPLAAELGWLARKDTERRARLEEFIANMPAEYDNFRRKRYCQANTPKGCSGINFKWYGFHTLNDPLSCWVEYFCECPAGYALEDKGYQPFHPEKASARQAEEKRRHDLLVKSGLPFDGRFKGLTLDTFALTENGQQPWFRAVIQWVRQRTWPGNQTGLILLGAFGVGKTGLLVAALSELVVTRGITLQYTSVGEFVDGISAAWNRKDNTDIEIYRRMESCGVLFLDDLGAGHGNVREWDDRSPMGKLFERLDKRSRNLLPTVITSNCQNLKELEAVIGERNMSRLSASSNFLLCTGSNLRRGVKA